MKKIKMKTKIKSLIFLFMLLATHSAYCLPTAKLTIKVIDETGEPVVNAKAGMSISRPMTSGVGSDSKNVRGLTDSDGLYTVRGSTEKFIGITVKKEGYYNTSTNYRDFTGATGVFGFRKWQPWNPTMIVVLKKIKNPIPMYVAQITGKGSPADPPAILPEEGDFFGFDLIAKDWVAPYGQGLNSDFIFKVDVEHYKDTDDYDATMTLKFANLDDGIQSFYAFRKKNSDLRLPHHAPKTNYEKKLNIRIVSEEGKIFHSPYRNDQNYFFRIRTKRDEQGNIIDAHYGKIYGNIRFLLPRENQKGQFYFSYYLNPNNNDTNVEFSPEKNLYPKPKGHAGPYRFKP